MSALDQALQEMQESAARARAAQAEEETAFRRYCDASAEEKHGQLGDEYIARARRTEAVCMGAYLAVLRAVSLGAPGVVLGRPSDLQRFAHLLGVAP